MKKILFVLALGTGTWMSVQAAPFRCVSAAGKGYQGTTMTLNLSPAAKIIHVTGDLKIDSKSFPTVCEASFTGKSRNGLNYYNVQDQEKKCGFDYIRVATDLEKKGNGDVSLVSRSGGDNHDWSGYNYVYLTCTRYQSAY